MCLGLDVRAYWGGAARVAGAAALAAALSVPAAAQFRLDPGDIVGDVVKDQIEDAVGDAVEDAVVDAMQDAGVGIGGDPEPEAAPPRRAAGGAPRRAAPDLVSAADPEAVRSVIETVGTADLTTDRDGAPKISGRIEGVLYVVTFHGCVTGEECRQIVFDAGFAEPDVSLETLNGWNRGQVFGVAYLDDAGDPHLKQSVHLAEGVTRANFEGMVERWRIALVEFRGFVRR